MATSYPLKRLWTAYKKLENWAASTDPTSKKKFKIETNSFSDETTTPSDELNDGTTASNVEEKSISIGGLIYPSTAPVSYPKVPPKVYMRMEIRHPNIEKNGESI
jgi:ubiquitin-protein ligase